MLRVFYFDIYVLFNLGSNFSNMTLLVVVNFGIDPKNLSNPFCICTPVGESAVAKQIYRKCAITVLHKVMLVDLIELDMVDFGLILGMDWIHYYYASIDYRTEW